jgi:hypothetical protein
MERNIDFAENLTKFAQILQNKSEFVVKMAKNV